MKLKVYKMLTIFFSILTFIGAGYVIVNNGEPSAGFSVIPMLFAIAFSTSYRNEKKKQNK